MSKKPDKKAFAIGELALHVENGPFPFHTQGMCFPSFFDVKIAQMRCDFRYGRAYFFQNRFPVVVIFLAFLEFCVLKCSKCDLSAEKSMSLLPSSRDTKRGPIGKLVLPEASASVSTRIPCAVQDTVYLPVLSSKVTVTALSLVCGSAFDEEQSERVVGG